MLLNWTIAKVFVLLWSEFIKYLIVMLSDQLGHEIYQYILTPSHQGGLSQASF